MPQYKLKIALENAPLKIERQLLIAADVNFLQLHFIIQEAMGWQDAHMFEFSDTKNHRVTFKIGIDDDEPFMGACQGQLADKVMLSEILENQPKKLLYWYDFGDDWWHKIAIQKVTKKDELLLQKMRLDGVLCHMLAAVGACPPEDCGGVWGYADLLEAINDPEHEEHEAYREWLCLEDDEVYDAELVEVDAFNKRLNKIHKKKYWNSSVEELYGSE